MSALAHAIAEALTRPGGEPAPDSEGLERRRLPASSVAAQAVAVVAPSPGMIAVAGLAGVLGPAVLPILALALLMMMLVAKAIAQFARRITAAGSLYTYTAKGLGPAAGFLAGCALLLAYASLVTMCLINAGRRLGLLIAPGSEGLAMTVTLLLGTLMTVLVIRGVRLSARITLLLEACSVTAVLGALVMAASQGSPLALAITPQSSALILAVTALVGFESGCGLSVETRRPFAVVPRVVLATPLLCGVLFVVAGALHLAAGSGPAQHPVFLQQLLHLGLAFSLFACAMAANNALVRVLFSMGRERALPAALGRIHPTYRTPYLAVITVAVASVVLPCLLWLGGLSTGQLSHGLPLLAVLGFLLAYLLVCLSVSPFLRRIGEATTATRAVALCAALAVAAVLAGVVASTEHLLVLAIFVAVVSAGMVWFIRVRRSAAIGYFDPAAAEDILPGAGPCSTTR